MNDQDKSSQLRSEYPTFHYHSYEWKISQNKLSIQFHFSLNEALHFHPSTEVNFPESISTQETELIDRLVFHLGLAEIPSYWKTTVSPHILIHPHRLSSTQFEWWTKLLLKGMGEFFFVNNIDFTQPGYVSFESDGQPLTDQPSTQPLDHHKYLLLVGGGKDSIVSLELLKKIPQVNLLAMLLNPTPSAEKIVAQNHLPAVIINRHLDPQLKHLNQQGYLNGHIPFSAYLAFLSILVAHLSGSKFAVASNESSSNEGNVIFHGSTINHQYSKSFEFEQDFRNYVEAYIKTHVEYFSLVRPLNELQISSIFAHFPEYFSVFKSCNKNPQSLDWCSACPKCVSTYLNLRPFIDAHVLHQIFRPEILESESNQEILNMLLGIGDHKPFECVASHEETYAAVESLVQQSTSPLAPKLSLSPYKSSLGQELTHWNPAHAVPTNLVQLIKDAIESPYDSR